MAASSVSPRIDLDHLRQWIGRATSTADTICPARVDDLADAFHRGESLRDGDPLPPLWHWLFFPASEKQSSPGIDGHPARGTFLPPVPLPRRMWAGGEVKILHPLRINQEASKRSTVKAVDFKQGKSGPLLFVAVDHEILDKNSVVLSREKQIIVYRDSAAASAVAPQSIATESAEWSLTIVPTPSLLLRYSALTFNTHRIHYDLRYATEVEGYPGLVVQGPLIATLLLELMHQFQPHKQVRSFTHRAVSPLFHNEPFQVCGRRGATSGEFSLWAQSQSGRLAMTGAATLA